ncbi:gamma-glutamylcyclotransferase family protein [Thioalkalivibrio sulfidiphilus]|uniref:gamma-glutamylcyclotransferase family protein n=1 Tax=Thioalkalivibrio sulfidiphilus TaxID=1033854 RepID=UPI003B35A66D
MSLLRYLAYGSNLHPERLRRRVPSAELQDRVCLPGWRLTFHKRGYDGSGKGHMVATGLETDQVWCAVYTFPARERGPLDEAERGYGITDLILPDGSQAFTYLALPERIDPAALPYNWYRDLIATGARFLEVPEDYVRGIEAHGCVPDPDPARAELNRRLLEDLGACRT